jgi:hypothetical protein
MSSLYRSLIGVAFGSLLISSALAAADIEVKKATFKSGNLLIEGTAPAGVFVKIDGTDFKDKANANGKFAIDVAYRPPNCQVMLTAGGATVDVLIDGCGPGVVTRGNWSANKSFDAGDLAAHEGSTWLALRANKGKEPGSAGSGNDWQAFAKRGPKGPKGPDGPEGESGDLASANLKQRLCDGSGGNPYDDDESYGCSIFCPKEKAAVTGWEQQDYYGISQVVDPDLVESGASYRFRVRRNAAFDGDVVKVAILCLNEPSPIGPIVSEP